LRRRHYDEGENGRFSEELAKVFGVPFEIVPFKETGAPPSAPKDRKHVFALPERANLEIRFPRVLRYEQVIRRVVDVDWEHMAKTELDPLADPAETQIQALLINSAGKMQFGAGFRVDTVTLEERRKQFPLQRVEFTFASDLTRLLIQENRCNIPSQRLFPQVLAIVRRYVMEFVAAKRPFERIDVWHSPFYGRALTRMREAIRGDVEAGETAEQPVYDPGRETGSTADVDFWTSKEVREVVRSHLNYAVADTKQWEQSAAYHLDNSPHVNSFVKNSYDPLGTRSVLGFTIPYCLDGEAHEYVPDFIARLNSGRNLNVIIESKGFPDPAKEDKAQAAQRWIKAINADGKYGQWTYAIAEHPSDVLSILQAVES
jgi:type III restriction enzyme